MSKVKILVVEDELVIAENICELLEDIGYEVLEPAIHYTGALQRIQEEMPDLALLDIELAGSKDGIDLATKIKEEYDIPFIFLTSNADPRTVNRAKKLHPPAYLVKPFQRDDLYTSIEMALYTHQAQQEGVPEGPPTPPEGQLKIKDAFFIKDKHLFHKVRFEDILFAKSDHVYVEIYTAAGKKHLIRSSMNEFFESLPAQFFRSHRSYTVNLDHLDAINASYVVIGQHQIPIGKTFRDELMQAIRLK